MDCLRLQVIGLVARCPTRYLVSVIGSHWIFLFSKHTCLTVAEVATSMNLKWYLDPVDHIGGLYCAEYANL